MIDHLIAWANAHALHLALALAIANGLTRLIPAAQMERIERDAPRLANALRVLRAVGPDAVKGWRAFASAFLGRVWGEARAIESAAKGDGITIRTTGTAFKDAGEMDRFVGDALNEMKSKAAVTDHNGRPTLPDNAVANAIKTMRKDGAK